MVLSTKIRRVAITFFLVDFAWIFFAANSLKDAIGIIKRMFCEWQTVDFFDIGLSRGNWFVLVAAIIALYIVDILHEKGISIFEVINRQEIWFRWTLYLGLLWGIIMFGIYGIGYDVSQFIYFQF